MSKRNQFYIHWILKNTSLTSGLFTPWFSMLIESNNYVHLFVVALWRKPQHQIKGHLSCTACDGDPFWICQQQTLQNKQFPEFVYSLTKCVSEHMSFKHMLSTLQKRGNCRKSNLCLSICWNGFTLAVEWILKPQPCWEHDHWNHQLHSNSVSQQNVMYTKQFTDECIFCVQ